MNRTTSSLKVFTLAIALLSLLALSVGLAYGQAISGNMVGTVVDSTGAAVANAEVAATNVATGLTVTSKTNSTGQYRFDNLPVGDYRFAVKASGFRTTTELAPVVLNATGTVNVTLTPGAATETVEVSGEAPTIDTTSAQLQSTFEARYSEDLGVTSTGGASGGVLNLSLLSPGVANVSGLGLGAGPAVGGQRPRDNNFTVEGVDNNNKSVTGNLITIPNDAVENFSVLENQFDAEFGHSSGGQFNTTVKSGTNSFHGSLYEYFRNRNLNATDNYWVIQGLKSNPRYDNNRYGGTFGGPIIKNKLFFFTNYERNPLGLFASSGGSVSTPTAAGLAAIAADPNLSANNFANFKTFIPIAAAGSAVTCIQYDGTLPAAQGESGFFPGQTAATAYSAPANGSCPAGKVETGTVPIVGAAFANYENFVQSADYNISEKDQIRGRFIFNRDSLIDVNAALPEFYLLEPFKYYLFTLGEYHTFTPALVNELRVGYNRFFNVTPTGNFPWKGLSQFPSTVFFDLGSGLQVGPDPNAPQFVIQNLYQVVDNLSWTKGKHTLKFGGEYRFYITPQNFTQRQRGDYEYGSTQLFMEDFAPDLFGERSTGANTYYGNQYGAYWYANDTFRMNQHLTLNLGVRYEYNSTPQSENQQILNAISNTPSIKVAGTNQPLIFGKPQAPKHDFAPRIGFAYSPGTNGTTSIRGGFGMAYDLLYDNIGILAVPPQIGATNDVAAITPGFYAGGGLPGGGSGVTVLDAATARASTSNWIPNNTQYPYSINWNLGVQHSFNKSYTAEVRYVGTRGVHLDNQTRINKEAGVTPQAFLPTYLQAPSQATLNSLTNTVASLSAARPAFVPQYTAQGFKSNIVCDCPFGSSNYHGLETSLSRRFSNGLQFTAAYTYSRTIDNSTADFFTSYLTPRRGQDFQNIGADRSVSALSRTNRFTLAAVYDLPYFKGGNWMMKNLVGNWTFAPAYTYESPEWATAQSAVDSNLNGDFAGDRTVINRSGNRGLGSDITGLTATAGPNAGQVVAYLATNPSAYYIVAGKGALATDGRNTLATQPTNNLDLSVYKNLNITERFKFRLGGQFANILNHSQLIPSGNPGNNYGVNDVESFTTTTQQYLSYVSAGNANFNQPKTVFPSNSRTISIIMKFVF
jgi:hypothetical protein